MLRRLTQPRLILVYTVCLFVCPSESKTTVSSGRALPCKSKSYKTFFVLNAAEHEIFFDNKYKNAQNS